MGLAAAHVPRDRVVAAGARGVGRAAEGEDWRVCAARVTARRGRGVRR